MDFSIGQRVRVKTYAEGLPRDILGQSGTVSNVVDRDVGRSYLVTLDSGPYIIEVDADQVELSDE